MMRIPVRGTRGFTLVEVLVAVVVLAIGAAGLVQFIAQGQQRNARRRAAEDAVRIMDNEVQRVRSAGGWNVPAATVTTRVDRSGLPDPAGTYRVRVGRTVACDAEGARPNDSGGPPEPCPGAHPAVLLHVEHLSAGTWTLRAERQVRATAREVGSGSWSPAGTP